MKFKFKNIIALSMAIVMVIASLTISVSGEEIADDSVALVDENAVTDDISQDYTELDENKNDNSSNPNGELDDTTNLPDDFESEEDPNSGDANDPNSENYVPPANEQDLSDSQADLEAQKNETEEKLNSLSESDIEYMELLDKKIALVNAQLMNYDNQIMVAQGNVANLQLEIDPLLEEIASLEEEYNLIQGEYDILNDSFEGTYDKYCSRIRAFYISGQTSFIEMLLSSKDLSQFLSRLELIKILTKKDTDFMADANEKMDELIYKQSGLDEQKAVLYAKKEVLTQKQDELKANEDAILNSQAQIASKKIELASARAKLGNNVSQDGNSVFYGSNAVLEMTYPVPSQHGLSQGYGHYSNGKPHRALDFPLAMGAPVVAAQKGIVTVAKDLNGRSYGRYIMIYHGTDLLGRKIVTLYAHNSELLVTPGQTVEKGQQIAKGGSTGNSTGPHCHFELRVDRSLVNPTYFLS